MKVFCDIQLGDYIQNVVFVNKDGTTSIKRITTPSIPSFLAEHSEIDDIVLKGPTAYTKKIQMDVEHQIGNSRFVRFTLQN